MVWPRLSRDPWRSASSPLQYPDPAHGLHRHSPDLHVLGDDDAWSRQCPALVFTTWVQVRSVASSSLLPDRHASPPRRPRGGARRRGRGRRCRWYGEDDGIGHSLFVKHSQASKRKGSARQSSMIGMGAPVDNRLFTTAHLAWLNVRWMKPSFQPGRREHKG